MQSKPKSLIHKELLHPIKGVEIQCQVAYSVLTSQLQKSLVVRRRNIKLRINLYTPLKNKEVWIEHIISVYFLWRNYSQIIIKNTNKIQLRWNFEKANVFLFLILQRIMYNNILTSKVVLQTQLKIHISTLFCVIHHKLKRFLFVTCLLFVLSINYIIQNNYSIYVKIKYIYKNETSKIDIFLLPVLIVQFYN